MPASLGPRVSWRRCNDLREGPALSSKAPLHPDKPDVPDAILPAMFDGRLDRLHLEGASLSRVDLSNQIASDIGLEQCRLDRVDLTGARLSGTLLQDTVVSAGSWANVRTQGLRLKRVAFTGVRITGADLSASALEDVLFRDCRIDLASLRLAKLMRVRFESCRMDEIDFGGAQLSSVDFASCTLIRALWTEATLTRCEIRDSDISGARNPERLRGVRMPWLDVLAAAAELAAAVGVEIVD